MKITNNEFLISLNDEKKRIDVFLNKKLKNLSRSYIKDLILSGQLKVNKLVIKSPSYKVKPNDFVSLNIVQKPVQNLTPFNFKLNIIFEDFDIMVVDKPAGISMHPGAGNYDKTIVNALINYNKNSLSNVGGALRPGIVHRIDKNTSGLVVIAKNNLAHENLSNQFSKHTIKRVYHLLVWGKIRPSKGRVETLITRSSRNRQMMEVSNTKGKKAITNYKTIEIFENENIPTLSLLECELETGRTHQIRVHMDYLGNSIVGDDKYKKRFKNIKNISPSLEKKLMNLNRQFLHAKIIGFIHPKKMEEMIFDSILPQELEIILKTLRKTSK